VQLPRGLRPSTFARQVKSGKKRDGSRPVNMDDQAISFGPFRLFTERRLLLEGDRPVRLGSRAFDILAALVERPGEVVGKNQLIARAWPQTFVEESNLKIQMSALRRALGDGQDGNRYVVTVPGRGYNFVAPIRRESMMHTAPEPAVSSATPNNLPFAATRLIGRDEAVATLVVRLARERLVTIVGAGGIGKTTVALTVAERLIADYDHGVWLVDLAPIDDPRLVPSTIATVLGLTVHSENLLPGLIAALRGRRTLLLLDNCEHVIEAVSGLVAALLGGVPGLNILVTSREPLGVAGEREYRLGPLGGPPALEGLTPADLAVFPAVQLFIERVAAIVEDFALTDENAPAVAEICRRLDGLPLAIEFAAPRVEALGVEGLAAGLGDSLPLLGVHHRTAGLRHQTMRAVADWSYGLLSAGEQQFLRALGIFKGVFTVEAAEAVAMDAANPFEAIDRLADLVAKSLVVADVSGSRPRFRLFDTTRAYAIEKLNENGERERIERRHAAHFRKLFEHAEGEAAARPTGEWLADYAPDIDNLRTTLDWAFSPGGDEAMGVALTAAAVPFWLRLSLLEECRSRAKQALGALRTGGIHDPREEMRLHAALGASTPESPEMGEAWTAALEIAESLGDSEYQLRALRGLCFYHTGRNRYRAALPFAQKFHELAARETDRSDQLFGARMMGVVKLCLGDHVGARRHLEHVLAHSAPADHGRDVIRFQIASRLSARVFLARLLWLQGFPDQALRTAAISVEEARATDHANSHCYALAWAACPIALWTGDLAAAARHTRMLLDCSRKHSLTLWREPGSRLQAILDIKEGGSPGTTSVAGFMGELVEAFVRAGRIAEALAVIDARFGRSGAGWIAPESLRLRGELALSQAEPETAEKLFRQALEEARRQEALAWELRTVTSLAHLLRDRGRAADAIACLQPVYDRFTEGFGTADLIAARQLLDELGDAGCPARQVRLPC
jgi:predicted ATPase/DNA-binding winged helix-turn-helix (wHTH) protein